MLEHTLPGLIEDLSLSFYCVAADIVSGNLVPLYSGPLAQAVAASMALPGIVPPVQIAGQHLVDGGVLDGVPIARMLDEADGPIIVSDVTAPDGDAPRGEQETPLGLMETVTRAMLLRGASASERARRHAALYITPAPESVGVREFHMLDRMRDSGRRATLEALESSPYTSAL
jgi:NTE family protein